jgi:hypothetical protein
MPWSDLLARQDPRRVLGVIFPLDANPVIVVGSGRGAAAYDVCVRIGTAILLQAATRTSDRDTAT